MARRNDLGKATGVKSKHLTFQARRIRTAAGRRERKSSVAGRRTVSNSSRAAIASRVFRLASADLLRENFNHFDVAWNKVRP
jgi:hypothetical protein